MEEEDAQGGKRTTEDNNKKETTIYEGRSEEQKPYVKKEMTPEIEGVIVIAEGGGNPTTVQNITEAVLALFDVDTHKIKIMKMVIKENRRIILKRLFKKNQMIITTLAIMIAIAGYLNYSGKIFGEKPAQETNGELASKDLLDISEETTGDIESHDGEVADGSVEGTPGEAVLTNGVVA